MSKMENKPEKNTYALSCFPFSTAIKENRAECLITLFI